MRRAGFSLIELIVVIGIMSVLIAVLTPCLNKSRLQARAAICMSNIRQLTSVLSTYITDNGRLPYGFDNPPDKLPAGGYAGYVQYDRKGWWWFNYLEELYGKSMYRKTVLQCPANKLKHTNLENDILCGNYGVNLSICKMSKGNKKQKEFVGEPLDVAQITHPSQTLLFVDSGYAIINWWHATDIPPVTLGATMIEDTAYIPGLSINRKRQLRPEQKIDAFYGRHPQMTVNVGFVDCHVARTKAEDLLVKTGDGSYENRSPLWVPYSR
jgi:prepilin-type N-terminal cleavage/methylation domain-containing protein/prepilin-type processing-associated H-X9-DG protein